MKSTKIIKILQCDICNNEADEKSSRAGYDFCFEHLWVKTKVESLSMNLYKDLIPEIIRRARDHGDK